MGGRAYVVSTGRVEKKRGGGRPRVKYWNVWLHCGKSISVISCMRDRWLWADSMPHGIDNTHKKIHLWLIHPYYYGMDTYLCTLADVALDCMFASNGGTYLVSGIPHSSFTRVHYDHDYTRNMHNYSNRIKDSSIVLICVFQHSSCFLQTHGGLYHMPIHIRCVAVLLQ